jgi:thiol:disulfide interchange protein DsbD
MGTALTFAFSQPAFVSLLVFTALGVGMATPYLVLSANPQLLKLLPRPGAWMETFKQAMAFPLLATLIWLTWVLSLQVGPNGTLQFLSALLLLSLAAWIWGRWHTPVRSATVKSVAKIAVILAVVGGVWFGAQARHSVAPSSTASSEHGEGIAWETFSAAKLDELRAAGKPVFIDFTVAWCITCKVNEFRTFGSDDVRESFEMNGVTPLVADWTNYDAEITAALDRFGRQSVPLYVYYAPGKDSVPQILPQLLKPEHVLEALNKK